MSEGSHPHGLATAELKMTTVNRQLILQSRPKGMLAPGDLQLKEARLPELKDRQALARVKYLSIDPTMRVWMAGDSYLPAVAIGEVMRALDRKSTRLNSSHVEISYAVFCLKKKKKQKTIRYI